MSGQSEQKDNIPQSNYNVILMIIISPILIGLAYESYWIYKAYKGGKEGWKKSLKQYFSDMFTDSIFKYLDDQSIKDGQSSTNQQSENENVFDSYQLKSGLRTNKNGDRSDNSCQISSKLRNQINIEPISNPSKEDLQEKLLPSPKEDEGDKEEGKKSYLYIWISIFLSKYSKQVYYIIVISNIFTLPLIYLLPIIFNLQLEDYDHNNNQNQTSSSYILSSIIAIFLQFILNISTFMYSSIITGQSVLLLISIKQKNDDMRIFLRSCFLRSFCYSLVFMFTQIFTYSIYCSQNKCSPEEFQKHPLVNILRYLASLFISLQMKSTYSNQKKFKTQRLSALYSKFYSKYLNEEKLKEDFDQIFPKLEQREENKVQSFKVFLKLREKQARNYHETMEKHLVQNKKFKLDNILTNRHMKLQVCLTLLYIFIILTQVALLVLALIFLYSSITLNSFDYYSSVDFNLDQNSQKLFNNEDFSLNDLNYKTYTFGEKQNENLNSSGSDTLVGFNSIVLVQAISMVFIRFSFQIKWILNENTKNRFR